MFLPQYVPYVTFLLAVSLLIVVLFSCKQYESYMDEIFHFPQAVKYFHWKFFEWDPKITTPPGLYLISVGILVPLSKIFGADFCNLLSFRLINLLFTTGNFYVLSEIFKRTHKKGLSHHAILLSALNLTTFPLLYFFTFLYYTDCGSVFFTLLMYLHHIKRDHWVAAAYGGIAVLFRQTNIIWVFMVAAQESLHIMKEQLEGACKKKDSCPTNNIKLNFYSIVQNIKYVFNWATIYNLMYTNIGYITIGLSFITFVFVNKSIALGDKEAHQVCCNIPQLFYFLLFVFCFAAPFHCSWKKAVSFVRFALRHKIFITFCVCLSAFIIKYMTHVHPYLLADNRHLTFYLWRRLLGKNIFLSLSLIPLYVFAGWSMLNELRHKDLQWNLIFMLCIVAATVPQKLIELRYFIIPYILFRINIKLGSPFQLISEFALYAFVNFASLFLFFQKTFYWENDSAVQRIMW